MNRVRTVSAKGSHKDNDGKIVSSPFIGLGGKSFANAGFSIGDKVEILSKYGVVTVKLIKIASLEVTSSESVYNSCVERD